MANFGQNFAKNGQKRAFFPLIHDLNTWQIWLILMIFSDLGLDLGNKNLPPQISASNGLQFFLNFYPSLGLECLKNLALISVLNELKILTSYEPLSQPLKKIENKLNLDSLSSLLFYGAIISIHDLIGSDLSISVSVSVSGGNFFGSQSRPQP